MSDDRQPTLHCDVCGADMFIFPHGADELWEDIAAMYSDMFDLELPHPRCGQCTIKTLEEREVRRHAH